MIYLDYMKKKYFIIISILIFCALTLAGCSLMDDVPTGSPHNITVMEGNYGTITLDKTSAKKNEIVTLTAYPNEGYEFDHLEIKGEWITESSFKMLGEDIVVTPYFRCKEYRVTYMTDLSNGESVNGMGITIFYVTTEEELPSANKNNYRFLGWYTLDNPDVIINKISQGTMGDLVLYPKFTPYARAITYHMPEGATHSNPTSFTVEDEDIILTAPEWENHYFLGWYKDDSFKSKISKIDTSSVKSIDVYPKFYSEIYDDEGYRLITSVTDFDQILCENPMEEKEGKYRLACDLDFAGDEPMVWDFAGEFDGDNHVIKGLSLQGGGSAGVNEWGLFSCLNGATIKNLQVEIDTKVKRDNENYGLALGFIGSGKTGTNVIENVHLTKCHINLEINNFYDVGGIVGKANSSTQIIGCSATDIAINVSLTVKNRSGSAGAIVGDGGKVKASHVIFEKDDYVICCGGDSYQDSFYVSAGGIAGSCDRIENSYVYMDKDVTNASFIKVYSVNRYANLCVGGLVGFGAEIVDSYAYVSELHATGGTDVNIGGLSGIGAHVENSLIAVYDGLNMILSEDSSNNRYNFALITNGGVKENVYTNCSHLASKKPGETYFDRVDDGDVADLRGDFVSHADLNTICNRLAKSWDLTIWDMNNKIDGNLPAHK